MVGTGIGCAFDFSVGEKFCHRKWRFGWKSTDGAGDADWKSAELESNLESEVGPELEFVVEIKVVLDGMQLEVIGRLIRGNSPKLLDMIDEEEEEEDNSPAPEMVIGRNERERRESKCFR